jgi:hypothetical protein
MPAPVPTEPTQPADDAGFGASGGDEPPVDDKPFDDEPFDAGVEADENTDPKKYIEQLSGKLGQSLRDFSEKEGQPDLELEKFAINSVISASHTADMDEEDKNDIIKKVNTSGDDNAESPSVDDNSGDSDFGNDNDGGPDNSGIDDGGFGDEEGEEDIEEVNLLEDKLPNLFLDKPKKNNMFQPHSNDILNTNESMLNKKYILKKLHEAFNQEQPPMIKPTRQNKPFIGYSSQDIEEARRGDSYQVYHDTFSSAVQTVAEYVEKKGFELNEEEWWREVSMGPRKPSKDETNRYSLHIYKDGKEQRKTCNFQVYNMGNKYELNMYFN